MTPTWQAGLAALAFSTVILTGHSIRPLRLLRMERRSIVSLGAGMSCAYVFVHVMPELASAREAFADTDAWPLPYEGIGLYYFSMVGFLAYYGFNHFRRRSSSIDPSVCVDWGFRVELAGFCAYAFALSLLLVQRLEDDPLPIAIYSIAIGFHLLTIDHELEEAHESAYPGAARMLLACMPLLGLGFGLGVSVPPAILGLLLAFVSGGVIVNSAIVELPSDRDGRFGAFLAGGLGYGLLLVPLG